MFIVKILRYIRGYVKFIMSGAFVERFINLCARGGIPIWGLTPLGDRWEAFAVASDYKRMRPITKPTGVRIRVQSKHGVPFIIRRYRKRAGLFAGLMIFMMIPIFMSGFIWTIEVKGNEKLESGIILEALEEVGLKPGVYRRTLDARELERRMMLAIDELSWIAINIQGSNAVVNIQERTPPPAKIDDEKKPANVVAARTGQIKRMEVYDGQPLLKAGDSVMKGEIIVSGITEDKHGNSLVKQARALVIAWVPESVSITVPLERVTKLPVGEPVKHRYLELFSIRIPISLRKKPVGLFDLSTQSQPLSIIGINLPVKLYTETRQCQEEHTQSYTQQQAKEQALIELAQNEKTTFAGMNIIDKNLIGYQQENSFFLRADYVLEMDIAQLNEIIIN